jgi:hypothetical protein
MTTAVDQEAIRVANRYASLIEKAETLLGRARACEAAAQQYRADARANNAAAEDHRASARTIRNPGLARQHALAARDAETEAAREILAARLYEQQAETYQAEAQGGTPAGAAGAGPALDGPPGATGHYDGAARPALPGAAGSSSTDTTGKEAMTASDAGALPDTARLTEKGGEHWHGSDVVTAASGDGTVSLALCQYPDSAPYVVVATNPPGKQWDPDSTANGIDPPLSRREADRFADTLDELVALAASGTQTTPPTRLQKVAARVRDLIGDSGVTIAGDEGEIEISAADMRKILDAAAPEPAVATRRKVNAKDCSKDGMDTGTVWAELDTSGDEPVVTIASTEGGPPEDWPEGYTVTRLSPSEARQLADKVRQFAATEPQTHAEPIDAPDGAEDDGAEARDNTLHKARAAIEELGYTISPRQLMALHGVYRGLVTTSNGAPTVYGVNVRRQLDALADKGMIARTGIGAYMIPFGSPGDQIIAATPDFSVATHLSAPGTWPAAASNPRTTAPAPVPRSTASAPAPAPAGPRQVTSPAGRTYEYDPDSGTTAIIEPDGWRAVVPAGSTTGVAARLLDWRSEIKAGRGQDASTDSARAMLAPMTGAELREVADAIGLPTGSGRTKAQLTDAIVNAAVASPLKHRGLAQGWW